MSSTIARRRSAHEAAANQRTADAVREGSTAQGDAARLLEQLQKDAGDGSELGRAVDALAGRSPAYRFGFFRVLQNALLRAQALPITTAAGSRCPYCYQRSLRSSGPCNVCLAWDVRLSAMLAANALRDIGT